MNRLEATESSALAQLEAICNQWNKTHKIGDNVVVHDGNGGVFQTTIKSPAYVLDHTAVIDLSDVLGAYGLHYVKPK